VFLNVARIALNLSAADTALIVYGYSRSSRRKERFALEALTQKNIFLAYHVNGRKLAVKHGFPLRVVAPDRWGEQWLKYVNRIEVVLTGPSHVGTTVCLHGKRLLFFNPIGTTD
jgi:DMSO/TMAO reductase YedYZ molybdopterin-dependent catalytic subunit